MKPYFQRGYALIKLHHYRNGKEIGRTYTVHRLVAMAFVPVPEWIRPGDMLDAHHEKKVIAGRIDNDHTAGNLSWVPRCLHRAFDELKGLWVRINGKWVKKDYITASEWYGASPYDLVAAVGNKQKSPCTYKDGIYEYYDVTIADASGKPVALDLKILR